MLPDPRAGVAEVPGAGCARLFTRLLCHKNNTKMNEMSLLNWNAHVPMTKGSFHVNSTQKIPAPFQFS